MLPRFFDSIIKTTVPHTTTRRSFSSSAFWLLSSVLFVPAVVQGSTKAPSAFLARSRKPLHRFIYQDSTAKSTASTLTMSNAAKLDSPSAQRNKEVILDVLTSKVLRRTRNETPERPLRILEIAAGSGVHTEHFASQLSQGGRFLSWFPTDPTDDALSSIDCYSRDAQLLEKCGVNKALSLTLNETGIEEVSTSDLLFCSGNNEDKLDLMICINMIHISPWTATLGLMALASERLEPDGVLYCYGPYKEGGTAVESNL